MMQISKLLKVLPLDGYSPEDWPDFFAAEAWLTAAGCEIEFAPGMADLEICVKRGNASASGYLRYPAFEMVPMDVLDRLLADIVRDQAERLICYSGNGVPACVFCGGASPARTRGDLLVCSHRAIYSKCEAE